MLFRHNNLAKVLSHIIKLSQTQIVFVGEIMINET